METSIPLAVVTRTVIVLFVTVSATVRLYPLPEMAGMLVILPVNLTSVPSCGSAFV
ncbi:hypothetical protein D3C71_2027490 [compost metagenome]